MDVPTQHVGWWQVPVLCVLTVIAIAEIWGSVMLGKMVHRGKHADLAPSKNIPKSTIRELLATRAYEPVILGEMIRNSGVSPTLRLRLFVSPGKLEQRVMDDFLSGAIGNVVVQNYIGKILNTTKDDGGVVIDLVDMKQDGSTPSLFLATLQNASSFVRSTNGPLSTTLFGF